MIVPRCLETGDHGLAKGKQPFDQTVMFAPGVQDDKTLMPPSSRDIDQDVIPQL
jgi:hypothetical protein